MIKQENHRGLLDSLKRLYSRITALRFKRRISSYHSEVHLEAGYDLKSTLTAHIDTMTERDRYGKQAGKLHDEQESDGKKRLYGTELIASTRNGFSRYIHDKKLVSETGNPLCDKLKQSTLEHIHTTLRLAHEGDKVNAKLHADFADSALAELSHYCSADEFHEFNEEIKEALSRVREA